MALYTINPPDPAAGAEWLYTVPGQYVEKIIAITARLTSTANPTTAVDSAGVNPGTYDAGNTHLSFGAVGPFAGGTTGQSVLNNTFASADYIVAIPNPGLFDVPTFTAEAIIFPTHANISIQEVICIREPTPPTGLVRWIAGISTGVATFNLRVAASNADVFDLVIGGALNAWHHVAITYDGAQWIGYVDGVASAPVAGHPFNGVVTLRDVTIGGDKFSSQTFSGRMAAAAVYSGALSAARVAAHNTAIATSAAAYKAAVLADAPLALWMLDQVQTHFQRAVTLEVTDGRSVVASYPGFSPVQESPAFSFTWAANAQGAAQVADQTTTLIPIAPMILPAGYTVGTRTLDLSPLDHWSNIVIWWDSSYMDATQGPGAYAYPPGAHLVYEQQKVLGAG